MVEAEYALALENYVNFVNFARCLYEMYEADGADVMLGVAAMMMTKTTLTTILMEAQTRPHWVEVQQTTVVVAVVFVVVAVVLTQLQGCLILTAATVTV